MKNKIYIYLLIIGVFGIINGSYLKLNGNQNANIIIITCILLKFISILGLIITNFSKIKTIFRINND